MWAARERTLLLLTASRLDYGKCCFEKNKTQQLYLLSILSFLEQLLGFLDMLRGLVDDALDVGEVGEAALDLLDHPVQSRPVDGQRDGQHLQSHLLYALWVRTLLCTRQQGEERKTKT